MSIEDASKAIEALTKIELGTVWVILAILLGAICPGFLVILTTMPEQLEALTTIKLIFLSLAIASPVHFLMLLFSFFFENVIQDVRDSAADYHDFLTKQLASKSTLGYNIVFSIVILYLSVLLTAIFPGGLTLFFCSSLILSFLLGWFFVFVTKKVRNGEFPIS